MKKIIAYLLELRAGILPTTILPILLGAGMAYYDGVNMRPAVLLAVILGSCFVHLGTNVINDYFDDADGTDRVNKRFIGPFTGGSRMMQKGLLSRKEVLIEAVMLFAAAAAFLIYAAHNTGIFLYFMAAFAFFSGIFYSAPPLKISRTGFGELMVALSLGPALALAAYYSQAMAMSPDVIIFSVPAGLLTAVFVVMAEFPDHEADSKTGKKNLVVRFGPGAGRYIFGLASLAAYAVIGAGLITGKIPSFGVWALSGSVLSGLAFLELIRKYKTPSKLGPACGLTYAAHFVTIGLLAAAYIK